MDDGLAHITSVQSSCNPEKAFNCLSDLNQIPEWNFNLAEVRMVESHLAEGILKLNGESILIRVSLEEEMKIIHFHLLMGLCMKQVMLCMNKDYQKNGLINQLVLLEECLYMKVNHFL